MFEIFIKAREEIRQKL